MSPYDPFEPNGPMTPVVPETNQAVQTIILQQAMTEWAERNPYMPYDVNAEQATLGSCLIDPRAIDRVSVIVTPQDFTLAQHHRLYQIMLDLAGKGEEVNIITIAALLDPAELPAVAGLASATPTSVSVESYARTVANLAQKRRLLLGLRQSFVNSLPPEVDADTALSRVEAMLFELGKSKVVKEYESTGEIAPRVFDRLSHVWDHTDQLTGLTTGYLDLDTLTNGMQWADLIYLAGRPSMGKTALALNIVHSVAVKAGIPCGIFSIEMSSESLYSRLIALDAQVSGRMVDTGKDPDTGRRIDQWERDKIVESIGRIAESPIYIDDTVSINPLELRSKARRMHAQHGLGLLVVDYIQLMDGGNGGGMGNRVQEVTYISRTLKAVARELNIPLLVCAQLSRAPDNRPKGQNQPILSDLRESGGMEQDADLVMFIYRDVKYNPQTERPHVADIIVAKQRNGPTGTVHLYFQDALMKFLDLSRSDDVPF